jgi:hypothetical protein
MDGGGGWRLSYMYITVVVVLHILYELLLLSLFVSLSCCRPGTKIFLVQNENRKDICFALLTLIKAQMNEWGSISTDGPEQSEAIYLCPS